MSDRVPLLTIAREWGRIGVVGFGGPPVHISLLRDLCVKRRGWVSARDFEDGMAAANLLPGPASTQLAILNAWWLRGAWGAVVGGVSFILPGLVMILALAVLFLAGDPPRWVNGAAAGAGSAVAAVAVYTGAHMLPDSARRVEGRAARARWAGYLAAGTLAAVLLGVWLVLVLIAAGLVEVAVRGVRRSRARVAPGSNGRLWLLLAAVPVSAVLASLSALTWVAYKVGALSYGGGFVIIPLMQADAVGAHGWMTNGEFLNAVALGQVTPGPVVQTVAVVGYAAAGLWGGLLAAAVAFGPSFVMIILGGDQLERVRGLPAVQAFFDGAGPAVVGAICGSAVPLALALQHPWQLGLLALSGVLLLVRRVGVVGTLLAAGALGVVAAQAGLAVS
ncbi:chromate efflux transporter [Streptomyces radicis]|uniref:Chromate efflux transporter n=1 Tax=Streptomyces radicis TaxID=1750517 RepID=A0A3A9VSU2_9ACTN|nr:chromate efflux transporter [Streptomyces radicis]RKN04065.1 chromate efflux transporter [Streptomyces radicis]RKN14454.1 chromate efflux transporter [Streptomyces radicis]